MKDITISEVFCEAFSGLLVIFFAVPWLMGDNSLSLFDLYESKISLITPSILVGLFIASYLIGLMADALGLITDELLFDKLMPGPPPTPEERKAFFEKAQAHILSYRDVQWAYYSLYRNSFLVIGIGSFLTIVYWWNPWSWFDIGSFVVCILILEVGLFWTMRVLARLYQEITRSCA